MVRGALATLLDLEDDIEVVGEAADGEEALAVAATTRPDIALLDIEMPGKDGIETAAELSRTLPDCRIVILTTFGRPGYLRRAMEAGASAFLVKDSPARELASAIRRVLAGERVIDPALAAAALSAGPNPLSPRERDVLAAAAGGCTIGDVARRLHQSEGTVRK
ncbi:MAG: DNA-binding response regulator [Actinoallomurus sp.]|nr:DNA-binding response regulator [Actinoallomurus sp.]